MNDRRCAECRHCVDDLCKHPQAKFHWGNYLNVITYMPEAKKASCVWPKAPGWCGYFEPTDGWLVAFAERALGLERERLERIYKAPKKSKAA